MFSIQSVSWNPLIATFQLLSAASLKWGRSQNGVLGNGLTLTKWQILDSSKLKEFVDDNFKFDGNGREFS